MAFNRTIALCALVLCVADVGSCLAQAQGAKYTVKVVDDLDKTTNELFPEYARKKRIIKRLILGDSINTYSKDNAAQVVGVCGRKAVGMSYNQPKAFGFAKGEILMGQFLYRPVVWQLNSTEDEVPSTDPQLLELPEGSNRGIATAINEKGDIVGEVGFYVTTSSKPQTSKAYISYGMSYGGTEYYWDKRPRSVVWRKGGTCTILPQLPNDLRSNVFDINNAGEIVGDSISESGGRAVIWKSGKPVDLNAFAVPPPKQKLERALTINNAGQILVVCSEGAKGKWHYVLLTPLLESIK